MKEIVNSKINFAVIYGIKITMFVMISYFFFTFIAKILYLKIFVNDFLSNLSKVLPYILFDFHS